MAGKIGFNSPAGVSGTNIYANQLAGGAVIQLTHGVSIYSAFNAFQTQALANHRLTSAPSGLSITNAWGDNSEDECDGCLRLTLAWTGTNRNVTSDTTVGIDVKGRVFQSSPLNDSANRDTWYTIGSFTIKPTAKGLELSTPTNSATVTEAGSQSTFTVKLSVAPSANVTVAISSGDTTEGTVSPSTMTFTTQNWSTAQTVTVTGVDDSIRDNNMNWNVVLDPSSTDTGYNALANVNAAMTTSDDEGRPLFSIADASVVEGDSGSTNMVFTVTMSPAHRLSRIVSYTTSNGTATAGSSGDYTAVTGGDLTIAAGSTSGTFNVSVRGDTLDEADETFTVRLHNAGPDTNIAAGSGTATGTILDDDPKFSIDSPSVVEGDSGSKDMTFTVTLSAMSTSSLTVSYAQTGGTATSGTDYTAVTGGMLTFAAGTTSQTITVPVTGDTVDEGASETVVLTLSGATSGAGIGTASGTGTITDDDPKFSIADASVAEGDSSSVNMTFTVTLSASTTTQTTVSYATSAGTATSGTDYTAVTAGMLTFAANSTSQTFNVPVTGDTTDEGASETFTVTLSNATGGAGIADGTATGTVTDDDPKFSIADASVVEGDSSSVNMTFTVTLSASTTTQTTVSYATSNGTATTAGSDYTARTGTLTFTAGTTTQTFTVSVTGDTTDEGASETFTVALSNATGGAGIADGTATGTITDDDPKFSIADASVAEGDSSSVNMTFTVTLSASTATQTTVSYATSDGTATTAGSDYTARTGTLTFAAGTTNLSQTFTVSVTGDTDDEGASETFTVSLSNATGGAGIDDGAATGTILDDDPKFSIADASVAEGDSSSVNMTFTVTLSASTTTQTTVSYATSNGTATTAGSDYTARTGTLTFTAGTTTQTFTVSVTGDTTDEGASETFTVALSNATGGAGIADGTATGTITDDDPKFSIADASVAEGDSSTTNMTFTVTLSASTATQTTVSYATSAGTATSGSDYTARTGTLTFATGTTNLSQTFTVSVTGDTDDEGASETFTVSLSNATGGAGIADGAATGTITDDDPKFSIDSPTVTEADSNSVNLVFTVTLSASSSSQLTVDYASSDGSANGATAGTDYTAVSGTLTFPAGTTSRTITVSVTGDTANELNETVVVTLSDATSGAGIATATGTGTITDNDTPNFSINSPSVAEGNSSTTNLVFTVTLSPAPASAATVNWAEGTGGTATSGTDYTAIAGGTLTFSAGTTTQTITVSVTGDTTHEADETVVLTLSNASTGTNIATASGTGTITNDDPGLTIDSPSVTEGDSGSANLVFTVTLDPASSSQVTVNYARTGGTATSGTDFTALAASTTLTFAASETSKTITVSVTGDTINEANETVIVTLSSASGADIVTASGTGTITDNDTPRFSIDSPSVVEGDGSSVNLEFTVTLSPASYQATTVDYATATAGTATAGTDFTAISATTLTFAAGDTSKTFMLSVTGDTTDEGAGETVVVTLSDATGNAEIGTSSGTGTITDNDPKFSIGNASATEGDSGSVNMTFTVTLSGAGNSQYTVDYASTDGTATAGSDYTAVSGTLTFAAGVTSRAFTVSVTGDTMHEANETLTVTLSNASAGTAIATASGTGTITDNDTPSFSIDSPSVAEGDSSTTSLTFTVTLSPASAIQETVNYADAGTGTATSGTDYTALASSTTLTFAAGTTSQTFTVTVSGDATYEADETVVITLSGASSGTNISTASGTGTITNDDPGLSIADASVTEGDSGSVNLVFTVTMSPAEPSGSVTVNYASSDGATNGATAGTDYTAASGTLTFAANETSKTITVSVTGDTENERDETVTVTLSNPSSGVTLVTVSATGTIRDNDTPGFSIDSPSVAEGDDGDSNDLVFTVSLSPASYQDVTVNYAVTGGTATSGTDYTAVAASSLSFNAGDTSKTITVSVTGDLAFEPSETVVITLSGASAGTAIATSSGTGTITNDDPGISIDSPTVEEVDEDETVTLTFTVTLEPAPTAPVTVDYADAGTGTAESGVDYTAIAGGTLTFAATETSKTISVSVIGDILSEPDETVVVTLSNPNPSYTLVAASGTGTITDNDELVQDELDMEIVAEVAREVTTSVVAAVSSRVASVVGGAAVAPPVVNAPPVDVPTIDVPSTGGFANGGLLSILARAVRHDRERDRGLPRSEMSLYRSLDGASFVYSPSALGATGASGGGRSGILTVWGSVDYRKMSGSGEGALTWDGELASLNIGTDTLSESGVLVGVAIGASKGSFGYRGSIGGTGGVLKMQVKTLNPYAGWSVSESASLWAAVGYGRGKISYNDNEAEAASSRMKLASAAFGGRYRLFSASGSADGRLVQVDLKGEAWGLQNEVEGDAQRPMGSKSRAQGMRIAVERHRSGVLESGASLVLSGEAGVRWDGGDGDTGTGFEMGGAASYGNSATGMKVVATARILVDHESDRKEWGAGLTVGCRVDGQETGMTYRSSLSHGQAESGVDSLWDSSAVSRASSGENSLATRLDAEVGYRFYGSSGLHTPYVGFGAEDGSRRDYRIGMRYAGGSAISSGLEFERREASSKRPDHRVMLTGRMNW